MATKKKTSWKTIESDSSPFGEKYYNDSLHHEYVEEFIQEIEEELPEVSVMTDQEIAEELEIIEAEVLAEVSVDEDEKKSKEVHPVAMQTAKKLGLINREKAFASRKYFPDRTRH